MYQLDSKLGKALGDAALAGFMREPTSPLRVETFLAALNRHFPEEVRPFVVDEDKFTSMCELSWPSEEQQEAYANSLLISNAEPREPGTAPGFNIQLDLDLERILLEGSDSDRLEPGHLLSIHDLLTLICDDERVSADLRTRWQVNLKAHR